MPRQNRKKIFYDINYVYDAFSIDLMQNTTLFLRNLGLKAKALIILFYK